MALKKKIYLSLLSKYVSIALYRYFVMFKSQKMEVHIEGHCDGPYLHSNCLLLTMGWFSKCIELVMCIPGRFAKGVVSSAAVCIRLL